MSSLSIMMIIFTPAIFSFPRNECEIPTECVESVIIRSSRYGTQVFINEDEYSCLCGKPGESVHIFKDEVLICCAQHRPTINNP